MKYIVFVMLFVSGIQQTNAQIFNDWKSLPLDHYIIKFVPYNPISLDGIVTQNTKYWWENEPDRQCLEFSIEFGSNTNYDVEADGYNKDYQNYWNKATRIMTNNNFGEENYISIGWRYNITSQMLELGFYGHRDHSDSQPRRIYEQLCTKPSFSTCNVQMALTKELTYLNIDGYALLTIKNVQSWDIREEIEIQAKWGWYGDIVPYQYLSHDFKYIHTRDFKRDRESFWNNAEFTYASNSLKIAHSRIPKDFPYRTFVSNKLYLSHLCESTNNLYNYTDEENVSDSQKGSFLIIEGGGNPIQFIANETIIGGNTIIEKGTQVYIGPIF